MINFRKIEIIDKFLNQKDYMELCNLPLNFNSTNNTIKVFHNKIDINLKVISSSIDPSIIKKLQYNYHEKAINILKNICPEKVDLYDYSDFTLISTDKDYKFPIHDDIPNKLLSGVIYLNPSKNIGTLFYSDKYGNNKKTIEWRKNRGVFFSRREEETWHSYEGDGISDRLALVYNLNTKNIKKVFEIEKKNYVKGMLRYKLNPFLHKYLKITI
tara:strand:+ start:4811 stop:5452 length:642 start_codon:yes stop_codon:yes gene_type:complete